MSGCRTRPAGAVLAVAIAMLGAAACSSGPVPSTHPGSQTPHISPAVVPPAPVGTDAENTALSRRASARVLGRLRLPRGSTRLARRPHGYPDESVSIGPVDRSVWYSTPLGRVALGRYLRAHPPRGTRLVDSDQGYGRVDDVSFGPRHPAAPEKFAGPTVLLQWGEVRGRAVVLVQTVTQARHVRPSESVVGPDATSVDVSRTGGFTHGSKPPAQVHLTITAPAAVAQLAGQVNGLYASFIVPFVHSCPAQFGTPVTDRITFHSGTDVLRFVFPEVCESQVSVVHNGETLGVTLDPDRFDAIVDGVIGAARR